MMKLETHGELTLIVTILLLTACIALNKWVILLAPLVTASSAWAILQAECPMETTMFLFTKSGIALQIPSISGAKVIILTASLPFFS